MKSSNIRTSLILALLISVVTNLMFFLSFLYVHSNFTPPEGVAYNKTDPQYVEFLFRLFSNFIISFTIAVMYFYASQKVSNKFKRILIIIFSCILITIIVSNFSSYTISGLLEKSFDSRFIFGNLMRDGFITIITAFSAQIILLTRRQQQSAIEKEKLIVDNMQSRYMALKNQIDPHFLFNSLNTLNALIATDVKKAQEYVLQLSRVFRYILQQDTIIDVANELDFTYSYCSLMKIRYGDNLDFDFDVDIAYDEYKIIPLSLQLLVENAIKHNTITAKQPLKISIHSDTNNGIAVTNKIQVKKEVTKGTGIGLTNLSERYRLLTRSDIEINNDDTVFCVRVPIFENL